MGRTAPAAAPSGKPATSNGPGSNGYWRRDVYQTPGTYTWTAKKDGRIKIQAIGAAAGAAYYLPGASGGYGEKELNVTTGQTLTIVVGTGGHGIPNNQGVGTRAGDGTATSISGTPVGGTALTIAGATGGGYNDGVNPVSNPGAITGPWDRSNPGAASSLGGVGSPSSGSPFGPGRAASTNREYGGKGWAEPVANISASSGTHVGGDGTHTAAPTGYKGGRGLVSKAGFRGQGNGYQPYEGTDGEAQPFWDLASVDSAGGSGATSGTSSPGGNAGPGAGGGAGDSNGTYGGVSALGGGTGWSAGGLAAPRSGNGGGGGGVGSTAGGRGGAGGNGYVQIFWDEVTL